MTVHITLPLSDDLHRKVKKIAGSSDRDIAQTIISVLESAISAEIFNDASPLAGERDAFLAMHSALKAKYLDQYVAILDGQLIDFDRDPAALSIRVHGAYPDRHILIRKVEREPETIIHMRSPRFFQSS